MKKIIEKYKDASSISQTPSSPWLIESLQAASHSPAQSAENQAVPKLPRLFEVFSQVLFFLGELDTHYEDELKQK